LPPAPAKLSAESSRDFDAAAAEKNTHWQGVRGLTPHPPVSILTHHNKPLKLNNIFEPPKAASAGLSEHN
jgi:hypothetical protein